MIPAGTAGTNFLSVGSALHREAVAVRLGQLPGWTGLPWSLLLVPGWRELIGQPLPRIVAAQWSTTTRLMLDDLEQLPRERWIVTAYDRFLADPQGEAQRICKAHGLEWARLIDGALPLSSYTVSTPDAPGNEAARLAMQMIGVPYRYGGADPKEGFDCSGLVYYTYTMNGYAVPRTAQDLFKAARKISLDDAIQGDLVFFQDQAKLSHVGIYLGRGMFVHAPSSGDSVSVSSLEAPYYQRHLVAVGRLSPSRR